MRSRRQQMRAETAAATIPTATHAPAYTAMDNAGALYPTKADKNSRKDIH